MSGLIKFTVSVVFCLFFFQSLQSVTSYPQSVKIDTQSVSEPNQNESLENKYISGDADNNMISFEDQYEEELNELKEDIEENFEPRIFGGFRPPRDPYAKHVVSIRYRKPRGYPGDNHLCAGSIVSTTAILTAAHCVTKYSGGSLEKLSSKDLTVVAGSSHRLKKGYSYEVDRFIVHPNYNPEIMWNDISVLYLKKEMSQDDKKRFGLLADDSPIAGTECTIVGWGRLFLNGPLVEELLHVNLTVWEFFRCVRMYGVRKGTFCGCDETDFDKDSCTGDSGGPVFCNNRIAGVVAIGFDCSTPGMPGVYTDVSRYYDWIRSNLNKSIVANRLSFMVFVLSLMFVMICY